MEIFTIFLPGGFENVKLGTSQQKRREQMVQNKQSRNRAMEPHIREAGAKVGVKLGVGVGVGERVGVKSEEKWDDMKTELKSKVPPSYI